jgi:hypothetical protein
MLIPLVPTNFQLTAAGDDEYPSSTSAASGARVIEFYVPATFQLPERRWIPLESRGKLIEFPRSRVKKSA